jgi:sugar-specific transcriptional regulator TrmB
MSLPNLQSLGLNTNEAGIYELLLRLGEVSIADIQVESSLKRTTLYDILYNLEKKGFITKRDKNRKIHFRPVPPVKLLEMAETQFTALERTKKDIQSLMPTLTSQYISAVERPVVRIYEGIEGVKKAHMEVLNEKKEILAYVKLNEEIDQQLTDFWPKYYSMRKKYNIFARVITPNSKGAKEYQKRDEKELRETRLVPSGKFLIDIEKDVVGNKVAFFSVTEDKQLIATVIENKAITDTERAVFELAWSEAGRLNEMFTRAS